MTADRDGGWELVFAVILVLVALVLINGCCAYPVLNTKGQGGSNGKVENKEGAAKQLVSPHSGPGRGEKKSPRCHTSPIDTI